MGIASRPPQTCEVNHYVLDIPDGPLFLMREATPLLEAHGLEVISI